MKWLTDKYEQNFLRIDFAIAAGSFLVLMSVLWSAGTISKTAESFGPIKANLYSSFFSLGGSLLGFLISAAAIAIAFQELPRFKLLKDSGQGRNIIIVFFDAMKWLSVLMVVSLLGLLFDTQNSSSPLIFYSLVLIFGICSFRVFRCIWILRKLTYIATSEKARLLRSQGESRAA